MSMTRKTITITSQMNDWVKGRIATGKYGNDSEYIRDLIRRDQSCEDSREALRALLIEGEESGISDRSVADIWNEVESRYLNEDG
jgi:antitoxin ParD1/3/4